VKPRPTTDEYRQVIGHFASGVTIVTSLRDGEPFGTTANAVSSLSLDPPMLLVCMNQESSTGQAIAATGRFAVNILHEGQAQLATHFATKAADKFEQVPYVVGERGNPLLPEALATLECEVVDEIAAGTHSVYLAEVNTAEASAGAPLAYFRGRFGRLEVAGG